MEKVVAGHARTQLICSPAPLKLGSFSYHNRSWARQGSAELLRHKPALLKRGSYCYFRNRHREPRWRAANRLGAIATSAGLAQGLILQLFPRIRNRGSVLEKHRSELKKRPASDTLAGRFKRSNTSKVRRLETIGQTQYW